MSFISFSRSSPALALMALLSPALPVSASGAGQSVDGGRAESAKASTVAAAQLLCAPGQKAVKSDGLGLFDTGKGLTLLPVKAGQACSLLATGAGLNLQFAGQGALLLAGPVNYRFDQTPRRVDVPLAEPVLCESYYTGTDKLALQITDTNGVPRSLRGFRRVDYTPSNGRFVPESVGPEVQCHAFPFSALIANPPPVPAPAPPNPDALFASGFDDGPSLSLELLNADGGIAIRELDVTRDQSFTYQIRVANAGFTPANGVRIREFVPAAAGQSLISPVVDAGSWSCVSSAGVCTGGESGNGALALEDQNFAARETRTYTLTRTVTSGAPPERTLLAAAVFFNPDVASGGGDAVQTDNAAPLVLELVPNQPPQFACSYPDRAFTGEPTNWSNDLPVAITLDEGDPAVEFECRVRDVDMEAFTLAASPLNSNPALIDGGALITTLAPDRFDVRISANAGQLGTGVVTQSATDVREGTGRVRVNVEVRDVNAPPSVTLVSDVLSLYPGPFDGPVRDGTGGIINPALYVLSSDCSNSGVSTCTVTFPQFFAAASVGASPESPGQQLQASIGGCSGTGLTGLFQAQNLPTITAGPLGASGQFQLSFVHYKSQSGFFNPAAEVTCTITVTDTGSPPLSTTADLLFRYQQP